MTYIIKYIVFHSPKIALAITAAAFLVTCVICIIQYVERKKVLKDETRYEHQRKERERAEKAREKEKLEKERLVREEKIRKARQKS
ncbi:hypothetical protein IJ103_02545 [Candidatus Saccharibacteria bacterium]|nr:hypothetical protein [Candidatus Saccharibacteria bacterium]